MRTQASAVLVGRPILAAAAFQAASPQRRAESGFAMLLVFALAAILAIGLYQQLPRVAFEAQREKEQLLIDHGEQYIRGVQLYVRKMGRYPAKMEDLDNTQNIRFLRKHYIDPMTGKDEWRLLHMGPAGKLIDSKIETNDPNKKEWNNQSITEFKPAGADDGGPENANVATRKRPSDDKAPTSMPGAASSGSNQTASNGLPGSTTPGTLPGMPPIPGAPGQNAAAGANSNSSAGQSSVSGNGGFGSSVSGNGGYATPSPTPAQPGQPGQSTTAGNSTPGMPSPYSTTPGVNQPNTANFGQPGMQATAASMINNLLTSPRPGGMPAGAGTAGIGGSVMGGLAGVASTYKGKGVKRYNDQDEYDKWEFYYDLSKEIAAAMPTVPTANPNATGTAGSGTTTSGFGSSNPSTPSSGFGNSFGSPSSPPPPPTPPPTTQ